MIKVMWVKSKRYSMSPVREYTCVIPLPRSDKNTQKTSWESQRQRREKKLTFYSIAWDIRRGCSNKSMSVVFASHENWGFN